MQLCLGGKWAGLVALCPPSMGNRGSVREVGVVRYMP
jgi:hypothetical protein